MCSKLIKMTTKEIIEKLETAFDGKNYIITSNNPLKINIEIPVGDNFSEKSEKIFDGIMLMQHEFNGVTKLDVTVTQSNFREMNIGN